VEEVSRAIERDFILIKEGDGLMSKIKIVIFVTGVILCCVSVFIIISLIPLPITTAGDVEQAEMIYTELPKYYFKQNNKKLNMDMIECSADAYTNRIDVYGKLSDSEKKQIIKALETIKRERNTKPLEIKFYEDFLRLKPEKTMIK